MTPELLKAKSVIEKRNCELAAQVKQFSEVVSRLRRNSRGLEYSFKARCLERLSVLVELTSDHCFAGYPITATFVARGVIETAGLLALFESRMAKSAGRSLSDKLDTIKKFVFATKKFGEEKRAVHALIASARYSHTTPKLNSSTIFYVKRYIPNGLASANLGNSSNSQARTTNKTNF